MNEKPEPYTVEIHPDLVEALRKEATAQGTTPANIVNYSVHGYTGLAQTVRYYRETGRTAELQIRVNGFFGWVRRIRFDGNRWIQSES